jgi:hypothetical protein
MVGQSRRRRSGDGGMVTAEFALALPALVLALVVVLWALSAAGASMRCGDAARAGARAAARGEAAPAVEAAVRQVGPRGALVATSTAGGLVTVRVEARVAPPGALLSRLPALHVVGRAVAAVEAP